MISVQIRDQYAEALRNLGNLDETINAALHRYIIEQIAAKIRELRIKNSAYQSKYGDEYPVFSECIGRDPEFVEHIENNVDRLWELDLADWEFCYKGIGDWTKKLQSILLI